jgi:hypothetical protein
MLITPEKIFYCLRKLEENNGSVTVDTVVRRDRVGVISVGGPSDAEAFQLYSALASRGLATKRKVEWGVDAFTITELGKQVLAGEVELPAPAGAIKAGEGLAVGIKAWEQEQRRLGNVEKIG